MSLYLDHFGLTAAPFKITPQPDFFFPGGQRGAVLEALIHAIAHEEGIVTVCGEVGSGKTMLCRMLLNRLPPEVESLYLANPSLARDEILAALAEELGLTEIPGASSHARLGALRDALLERHAAGRRVVLLIDEAHAMPAETLEEIRLISNLETDSAKLLQVVLFAQPELEQRLAGDAMRPLRERITQRFDLRPLSSEEVGDYLEFRLRAAGYRGPNPFSPRAARRIARASLGLSRRINILADKSLLSAFASGSHSVDRREIVTAIADARFSPLQAIRPRPRWGQLALFTGAIVLLAGATTLGLRQGEALNTAPEQRVASAPTPQEPDRAVTSLKAAHSAEDPLRQNFTVWLNQAPRHAYFIQIFAGPARGGAAFERALSRARASLPTEQLRVYRSSLSGQERIGIIYGQFPDRASANQAIASLPASLKSLRPYPRQIARLL